MARRSFLITLLITLVASWVSPWGSVAACAQELTWFKRHSAQAGPPVTPHPAIVRVLSVDDDGTSMGSGTLIDLSANYGLVITNWHVVRDTLGQVTVIFPQGYQSPARIAKVDEDWDLAALLIWRPPVDPIRMASRPPRPGDAIRIAGYGSGRFRVASGRVNQFVSPGRDLPFEMIEVTAEARQGDSGGPMLNANGELAGVLFGSARGTTSGSHSGRLQQFLSDVFPLSRYDRPAQEAATTRVMAQATRGEEAINDRWKGQRRVLGEPQVAGMPTAASSPNSPALAANSRPADAERPPMVHLNPEAYRTGKNRPEIAARWNVPQRENSQTNSHNAPRQGATAASERTTSRAATVSNWNAPSKISSDVEREAIDSPAEASGTQLPLWRELTGVTPWEQGKTVLALIGLLTVVAQLVRVNRQRG